MTISYINNNFFMEGSNGNLDDFICLRDISISLCLTPTIVKTWHIFYPLFIFASEVNLFGGIHALKQTFGSAIDAVVLSIERLFITPSPLFFPLVIYVTEIITYTFKLNYVKYENKSFLRC